MHVGNYLTLVDGSEQALAQALLTVAQHHGDEPDVLQTCKLLSSWSDQHTFKLRPLVERYGQDRNPEPERLQTTLFHGPRNGSLALLRDLHDLYLLATEVSICWTVLAQAAAALRDPELTQVIAESRAETQRQLEWLQTRIKQAAPQALIAA